MHFLYAFKLTFKKEINMVIPVIGAAQFLAKKYVQNKILPIKSVNEGEDLVIEEMKNPNSPMLKSVEEWTDWDKFRAEHSPSYQNNYYLQDQVKQYNEKIIDNYLQGWRERDKIKGRNW